MSGIKLRLFWDATPEEKRIAIIGETSEQAYANQLEAEAAKDAFEDPEKKYMLIQRITCAAVSALLIVSGLFVFF